ncbi:hypothetical protein BCV72DRAFT_239100 [Rhizopus microsporus var. microsporus]|uniref:Uncharacterized protein n=2 Tax=Rhizopus microsporus TaxID=58291 RepID=A0A2G4ST35_RHIZD|nr:uncharacterized protein RHIMIDRAFT_244369 [Rhizopus microsporus ATCC 52813]ORE10065.1 hypothetical protein BCV72DRAFT_239100 [Rhizopus microsporus var. microsporus]PHZ11924.1 hypothetical protein RHIMIDRAFT_244369 [Rhizopus microsporus ATCC 52813]
MTAFKDNEVKALFSERASGAVTLVKNEDGVLEAGDKKSRKTIDAKVDILFEVCYNDHSLCEVGKDDVTVTDNKYLDDRLKKLSKTLRDMMLLLVQKNPRKINNLWLLNVWLWA